MKRQRRANPEGKRRSQEKQGPGEKAGGRYDHEEKGRGRRRPGEKAGG